MQVIEDITLDDGRRYRIVDDLPNHGGFFSVERADVRGGCTLWRRVSPCFGDAARAREALEKLAAQTITATATI